MCVFVSSDTINMTEVSLIVTAASHRVAVAADVYYRGQCM